MFRHQRHVPLVYFKYCKNCLTSKMARSKKCTRAHEKTTTNFLCTPATAASVVKPAVALTRVTSERVYATRVCVARTWIALVYIHTWNSVPGKSVQTGARKVAVRVRAIWSVVAGTVVQSRITAFIWIEQDCLRIFNNFSEKLKMYQVCDQTLSKNWT